jgi:hypothetical protein
MKNLVLTALVVVSALALAAVLAAAEAAPAAMPAADLKWTPNPNAPGVMTATVWGDPATGAHGAFHKFVAGFMAPLHTHPANHKAVVISGTMSVTGKDGKETKLPPGSYFSQPNTWPHVTKCLEGSECVIYVDSDAKWGLTPVETAKKQS